MSAACSRCRSQVSSMNATIAGRAWSATRVKRPPIETLSAESACEVAASTKLAPETVRLLTV